MMPIKRTFILSTVLLTLALFAAAQHSTPYSRFGLGTELSTDFGVSKGFGQLGSAFKHPFNSNYTNPASYSKLKLTTLETGVYFNRANFSSPGGSSFSSGDASMDYLALGFPITDFWGTSIGLIPFSKVRYDYQRQINHPELGKYKSLNTGSGQLYQFYWGNGFNYNNISIGFNVAFLFGNVKHREVLLFPDSTKRLNTWHSNDVSYKDIIWNIGAQYNLPLNNDRTLTFGIQGSPSTDVYSDRTESWQTFSFSESDVSLDEFRNRLRDDQISIDDTAQQQKSSGRNTTLPLKIGAGAMLQKENNWRVGVDLEYTGWDQFNNYFFDEPLTNSWRIGVGGQITPDPEAVNAYLKRMQYRLGGYYNTGRLEFEGQRVAQYGMTFGFSLPINNTVSKVTIAGDIGTYRAPGSDELVDENYYKLNLSFTLNDKWFTQRKIK
ncbi:MAG: hypothetical protein BRD50_01270 [Bacteroidetes bacterium SW_11_45_7]|nr:MAG: hypothetical protein BRD50_01270 [Bacteroidetes bacterium SW_11_45_7]